MKLIPSILALSVLAAVGFSGCASDPEITSQTTTTRRVVSEPATTTTVVQPASVQQTTVGY